MISDEIREALDARRRGSFAPESAQPVERTPARLAPVEFSRFDHGMSAQLAGYRKPKSRRPWVSYPWAQH